MREKLYDSLQNVYSVLMSIAFFGGFVPLPVFIAGLIVGPSMESICLFMYKQYYPIIIAICAIGASVGLVAMYVGKKEGLSVKNMGTEDPDKPQTLKEAMHQNDPGKK